jgi:hypothetical protein
MRRLLTSLMGLILLGSVLGCHTAGRCDCTDYTPCAGGCCLGGDSPVPPGQINVEHLKVMPKGGSGTEN